MSQESSALVDPESRDSDPWEGYSGRRLLLQAYNDYIAAPEDISLFPPEIDDWEPEQDLQQVYLQGALLGAFFRSRISHESRIGFGVFI